MNTLKRFFLAVVLCSTLAHAEEPPPSTASHPDAVRELEQVVQQFQQDIRAKDGKALAALFLPENNGWLTVESDESFSRVKKQKPDARRVHASSYQEFVSFVSGSKRAIEERFSHVRIETNGSVAAVYFDFEFLVDGAVNNRGSESWPLVKTEDGWKISSMIYSNGR